MKRPWLEPFDWGLVTQLNKSLCEARHALHKPTTDGHDACRALWDSRFQQPMTLPEAVELCRQCHRMAPFCFYNGNTFVTIIREVLVQLNLPPDLVHVLRSWAGHIVAGTDQGDEREQFAAKCREWEAR